MTAKEAFQNLFLDVWKRDEEINKKQLIVLNALTELDELKRDVVRYFGLYEQAREKWGNGLDDVEAYEFTKLHIKLLKVGKEE